MAKNKAGQPPKYDKAEDLQDKIDEYFEYCDNRIQQVYSAKQDAVIEVIKPEPYGIENLAHYLGFSSRQSISDYEEMPKFSYIIKRAKLKIKGQWVVGTMEGKNAVGYMFQLCNNYAKRYTNQQKVEHSGTISIAQQIIEAYGEK